MVAFQVVMGPLTQALGLSVVVERLIEFGKNIAEPSVRSAETRAPAEPDTANQVLKDNDTRAQQAATLEQHDDAVAAKMSTREQQSDELNKIRERLRTETNDAERAKLLERSGDLRRALQQDEAQGEWDERVPPSAVVVEAATQPDEQEMLRTFVLQVLGLAVGILLATFAKLELFNAFLGAQHIPSPLDHLLSGLLIGGGSAPVHTLIRFISDRKTTVEAADILSEEDDEQKAPPPVAAATAPVTAEDVAAGAYIDIPYEGGVDVKVLEGVHRRKVDPDLVVFHHTAMSSKSTFEDVVKVITHRTSDGGQPWITGYNCVILSDGSIHAFCRWDRYGNHAVGYNQRSLGISFNGNFETNPAVPYSNADGRYGAIRPTDVQLRAGARVVALWSFLYPKIDVADFKKTIIPHRQISSKACPGSNFPYAEFEDLVKFYRKTWEASPDTLQRIEAFRHKPYLFTTP